MRRIATGIALVAVLLVQGHVLRADATTVRTFAAYDGIMPAGVRTVVTADFTGDGRADVFATLADGTYRLFGYQGDPARLVDLSGGDFSTDVALAGDFNGDGKVDVAGSRSVMVGDGAGGFTSKPVPDGQNLAGARQHGVAVGDLNRDGKHDIVSASGNVVLVYGGRDDGTLHLMSFVSMGNAAMYPDGVAVGDVNRDGKADAVVTDFGTGDALVLLGSGDGWLSAGARIDCGDNCGKAVLADLNGDGHLDLATLNGRRDTVATAPRSAVTMTFGRGDGTFSAATGSFDTAWPPRDMRIADVTHDGIADIAVVTETQNWGQLHAGLGDGRFSKVANLGRGIGTLESVDIGDVDANGSPDVVIGGGYPFWTPEQHGIRGEVQADLFTRTTAKASSSVSLTGTSVDVGQPVVLKASVTSPSLDDRDPVALDPVSGTVTFKEGGSVLGTAEVRPTSHAEVKAEATFTTTLPWGPHSITATYSGDANHEMATSSPVVVAVGGESTRPVVEVASPAENARYPQGQHVLADFSCSDPSGVELCEATQELDATEAPVPLADGAPLDTSMAGRHVVNVAAMDIFGNRNNKFVSYWVVAPDVAAGAGTVTTDADGSGGATPEDPIETTVVSPVAGSISVRETVVNQSAPTGYTFLGQQVDITAPVASAANPLVLTFDVDPVLLPPGSEGLSTVQVFRNGVMLPACTSSTGASPDPCAAERTTTQGGDLRLTVRTSAASKWNVGVSPNRGPTANAGLDRSVVANTSISLDGSGSSDPENRPLTYKWMQLRGPQAVLPSPQTTKTVVVTPSTAGTYTFRLIVRDTEGQEHADDVTVTVSAPK